jgi:hypothetical protein
MKVSQKDLEAAYQKEEDLHKQLESFNDGHFLRTRTHHEFDKKDAKKIGDIWETHTLVNGHIKEKTYSIWHDVPNYMKGLSLDETLSKSETEKVLFQNKKYRISLLRDTVLPPTDTYWGNRIQPAKYALFDGKGKLIYKDDKKWRFTQTLLHGYEEKQPKGLWETLKAECSPFRYKVINFTDKEQLKTYSDMMGWAIDRPDSRTSFEDLRNDRHWVVMLIGLRQNGYKTNSTWFIVESVEKPTIDACLVDLFHVLDYYREKYWVVLEQMKTDKVDMNTVNFEMVRRIVYVVTGKLYSNFLDVLDISGNTFSTLKKNLKEFGWLQK